MKFVLKFLLVVLWPVIVVVLSDYYNRDAVADEFSTLRNELSMNAKVMSYKRNEFICYSVESDDIDAIWSYPSKHSAFEGWVKCNVILVLGAGSNKCVISGGDVWRAWKRGSSEYNQVSIYLDKGKGLVYLCRLLT